MVVNSILRAGKFCGKTSLSAAGSAIQDILKLDDKVLDNLILAQQKAKKGFTVLHPGIVLREKCRKSEQNLRIKICLLPK